MEYITDTSILTIKDMSEIVSIKINDNRSKIYYKISIEDLKSIINS